MNDLSTRKFAEGPSHVERPRGAKSLHRRAMHALFGPLWQWPATLRAARAADEAYETARARGETRDAAADKAFQALTGEPRRRRPAETSPGGLQDGLQEDVARRIGAARAEALPGSAPASTSEMDMALAAIATPRSTASAHGDLRVAALCFIMFVCIAFLGIVVSLGVSVMGVAVVRGIGAPL